MSIEFVDLRRQYASIRQEVDAALLSAVASAQYILGEEVEAFEREFARFCEAEHCVGVSSGTAAVSLALEACGVGPGDEVIAPANTFIASVSPIVRLGAQPVLVDCDPRTAQIDPELTEAAITPRTKAIVAVHLYGHPADMEALRTIADRHALALVEDAAQAHGARHRGRRVGGFGRIAAFSFYPGKNLGALGDGGAVVTNDAALADRVRVLRNLGQSEKYRHVALAGNERLDTVQAAVLRVKLRHLDGWNELRRAHADRYATALTGTSVTPPVAAPEVEPVWHLYVIRTPARDAVRDALARAGIASGMHYPLPLHLQPALASLGHRRGDFPHTEAWADELLSLPMFPELRGDEIDAVAEAVSQVVA